jgi:hypothetical protein
LTGAVATTGTGAGGGIAAGVWGVEHPAPKVAQSANAKTPAIDERESIAARMMPGKTI